MAIAISNGYLSQKIGQYKIQMYLNYIDVKSLFQILEPKIIIINEKGKKIYKTDAHFTMHCILCYYPVTTLPRYHVTSYHKSFSM